MAKVLRSDIIGWYTNLNAVRTRLGLAALSVPNITANTTIAASAQAQAFQNEFNSMKTDKYFRFATYSDLGSISKGSVMRQATKTAIESTISNVDVTIKCRNDATNNYGSRSVGCGYGTNTAGTQTVACQYGTNSEGTKTVLCSYGTDTAGTQTVACQYGTESNRNGCGYVTRSVYCDYVMPGCNFRAPGTHSYGGDSAQICQYLTKTNICPQGTNTVNCGKNCTQVANSIVCSKTCTQGNNSITCSQTCTQGTNSNTTVVDVSNSLTTKSNTSGG